MRFPRCTLGVLLIIGCRVADPTITLDSIDAEDNSAASYHLRATHPLGERESEPATKFVGIEVEFHSGDFDDGLGGGDNLQLDQNLISGPAEMRGDFDLSRSSLFVEWRDDESARYRFTRYAGLSFTNLDMQISAGGTRDTLHDLTIGPMLGGRMNMALVQDIDAYAKLEWHFGKAQTGDVFQAIFEAGANWQFHRVAGLNAGWQLSDFQMERDSDDLSDIDLSFGGPFVTLLFSH